MSSGRRDYVIGFQNELAVASRAVYRFGAVMTAAIAADTTGEIYNNTLVAGYRRKIGYIRIIGGTAPGNILYVKVNGATIFFDIFGSDFRLVLPDLNHLTYKDTDNLIITIFNKDTVAASFGGYIHGTTELTG